MPQAPQEAHRRNVGYWSDSITRHDGTPRRGSGAVLAPLIMIRIIIIINIIIIIIIIISSNSSITNIR